MNKFLFVISLFFVFIIAKNNQIVTKVDSNLRPYELQDFIKSYPSYDLDVEAYQRAVLQAKEDINNQSNRAASWQYEGPENIGGRITAIAVSPTDTNTFYIGTPNNGIFKTTDGGKNFSPIFDDQSNLSVGCIAIHPTNPSIIFAGTGDPVVSGYPFVGNGLYKSLDAGKNWSYIGLGETKVINKIAIDPQNPNNIYVATMGLSMKRTDDRGLYKSTDGGKTWKKILFIDNQTGCSNVLINPQNPNIVFTTTWTRIRNQYESLVSGDSSRIYRSLDGGLNWTKLVNGLPDKKRLSKCGICMSKTNPNKLYAIPVDSTLNHEGVYVTTNNGDSFTKISSNLNKNTYGGFGWYFGKLEVHPKNDSVLFVCGVDLSKTTNGGKNFDLSGPKWNIYEFHADKHDIQFLSDSSFLIATDGGLYKTTDNGNNFKHFDNLPLTQFYRVAYNPFASSEYFGGAQDNGTTGGNNDIKQFWPRIFGGDGFQPIFDPKTADKVLVSTQNGGIAILDNGAYVTADFGVNQKDRVNWDMPIHLNDKDSNLMYLGTYRVYKNTNGFNPIWDSVSTDLTDGILTAASFHNISAIHSSAIDENIVYAGTSDANVWTCTDGAINWRNITAGLPEYYVSSVKASPNVINNVYVTHTGYKWDNYIPHIHKSMDNGKTWTDISGNLVNAAINDVYIMKGFENLLFVATDMGVYYTINGGLFWNRLGNNMPIIKCTDIEYNPELKRIFVGTYARSMMSIDISELLTSSENILKDEQNISMSPTLFFSNQLNVKSNINIENVGCSIYSINGNLVEKQHFNIQNGNNNLVFNGLNVGAYVLSMSKNGKIIYSQKFIKQ